jgi:hypothetical protein
MTDWWLRDAGPGVRDERSMLGVLTRLLRLNRLKTVSDVREGDGSAAFSDPGGIEVGRVAPRRSRRLIRSRWLETALAWTPISPPSFQDPQPEVPR